MSDDNEVLDHLDNTRTSWQVNRGSGMGHPFVLEATVTGVYIEPTRNEVRDALNQILNDALGPDPVEEEIRGWAAMPLDTDEELIVELEALRRWKEEALPLLATLDQCHDNLPAIHQANLGDSKAGAVLEFIRRHRRTVMAE